MAIYHGQDLRRGRVSEAGRPYLITTVTRNRYPCFSDWWTGRQVVKSIRDIDMGGYARTLAWVVMPDHLHWLVIPESECLEVLVRRLKSCSARAVNAATGKSGPLWQKGYHDRALRREENLPAIARYIIANPLRARLVDHIGEYPLWDSVFL